MNPVNASNQTFGCDGIGAAEHIFVYWAGPLLAAALAAVVHRKLTDQARPYFKTIGCDKQNIIHDNVKGRLNGGKNGVSYLNNKNNMLHKDEPVANELVTKSVKNSAKNIRLRKSRKIVPSTEM